jgi:hypothetical protein
MTADEQSTAAVEFCPAADRGYGVMACRARRCHQAHAAQTSRDARVALLQTLMSASNDVVGKQMAMKQLWDMFMRK